MPVVKNNMGTKDAGNPCHIKPATYLPEWAHEYTALGATVDRFLCHRKNCQSQHKTQRLRKDRYPIGNLPVALGL
jgi:hypothetical protein